MDFLTIILKPWPARGICFLLGALGALAFAPLFIFPAILLTFSCIWFLLEQHLENNTSYLKLFYLGWWFGLGHFTVGLYWISFALTVDLNAFWWVVPFALFGIPSILAVFTGIAFAVIKIWPFQGISRAFAFAATWVGLEWIRGHIFTGFPWNLAGYTWGFNLDLSQLASLIGIYGLSLLVILLSLSINFLVKRNAAERNAAIFIGIIVLAGWFWGKNRLLYPEEKNSPSLAIRIVQPNIPQTLKWKPLEQHANLETLLALTDKPSPLPLKAVIWPETAVSFFLEHEPALRKKIAHSLPKESLLFTGALRRTPPEQKPMQIWNSLIVMNDQGEIVGFYDKSHLVPFGEYLPFRTQLDKIFGKGSIKKITAGTVDFTSGPGPQSIQTAENLPPFSGLVCYEVIFPSAIINRNQPRPGWIINVTNDGWYGKTSGPYQHLEMTRFRAIEEGVPLIRAANTGISAVFNAYGQTLGSIALGKQDVLDVLIPAPTYHVPLYAKWGDWITLSLILSVLFLAFLFSFIRHPDE